MTAQAVVRRRSFESVLVGGPAGFRHLLERMGPTFIKFGQFLSLRPDLLHADYRDELFNLLDNVPAMPWHEVRAILREEFGRDPGEVFAYINPQPQGAGSLAQAHLARLHSGESVIVKIRRRGIEQRIERDLRHSRLLARLLEAGGASLILSPQEAVAEMADWLRQELDFGRELANMNRLHELSAGSPSVRIPRPYPEYSTAAVLTAEFLDGIPLSDLVRVARSGGERDRAVLERLGFDLATLTENLLTAALTQIFDYRFFHADLHPGNLLVLSGGVVGFVDFGLCTHLDNSVRDRLMRYFGAVINDNSDEMFHAAASLLESDEHSDLEGFRRDFYAATSVWTARRAKPAATTARGAAPVRGDPSDTGHWLMQIVRSARRTGMRIPTGILSLYRTLLTAESVATMLTPAVDLRHVGRVFFPALQLRDTFRPISPLEAQTLAASLLNLLRDAPAQAERLLADLSGGRFTINVQTSESNRDRRLANRRARLVSAAVVSVGLALLLTHGDLPSLWGVSSAWPLAGALLLLYGWMIGQWRQLK